MQALFDSIMTANKPTGEVPGLQYGIVADTADPLNLQRLQVYDPSKGGKHRTDWLTRCLPFTDYSPPLPKVGDLVAFGYIGNNPHFGVYLGVITNQNNSPVGSNDDLTVKLGATTVNLKPTGEVSVTGASAVTVESTGTVTIKATDIVVDGNLEIKNATSVKIGSQQIATIGATDTAGHTLVNKGW